MLPTHPESPADERGFMLIELLVVVLIIGILAAIAIPSFLNQKGKANDANAKAIAHTAQVAEETIFTDGQTYLSQAAGTGPTGPLNVIDTTLIAASAPCVGTAPYQVSPCGLTATAVGQGFTISVTSRTGVVFTVVRNALGVVSRTCDISGSVGASGGCTDVIGTVGTW